MSELKKIMYQQGTRPGRSDLYVEYALFECGDRVRCVYTGVTPTVVTTVNVVENVWAAIQDAEEFLPSDPGIEFYDLMTHRCFATGPARQKAGTFEFARVYQWRYVLQNRCQGAPYVPKDHWFDYTWDHEVHCPPEVLELFRGFIGGDEAPVQLWNGRRDVPENAKVVDFSS